MQDIWNVNKGSDQSENAVEESLSLPPNWKRVKHTNYVSWRPGPQTKGWEHLQSKRGGNTSAP